MLARPRVLTPLVAALALAACAATPPRPPAASTPAAPLPDVTLALLDGTPAQLRAQIARRPALLSLWATWCEPCIAEQPALGRLVEKAAPRGAYVVAISQGEPRGKIDEFVRGRGLKIPQLVDEPYALGDALGQRSVPATIVVDREGLIVHRGAALDQAALEALDRALAQ